MIIIMFISCTNQPVRVKLENCYRNNSAALFNRFDGTVKIELSSSQLPQCNQLQNDVGLNLSSPSMQLNAFSSNFSYFETTSVLFKANLDYIQVQSFLLLTIFSYSHETVVQILRSEETRGDVTQCFSYVEIDVMFDKIGITTTQNSSFCEWMFTITHGIQIDVAINEFRFRLPQTAIQQFID